MRLTGGEARGRRLRGPGGQPVRPTSDRVREALFDILGERTRDAAFLDGFAGTGAVGVEALSRGARRVVFVERSQRAIRTIRENLKLGAWEGRHEILHGDLARLLDAPGLRMERFGVVFLDPPYDRPVGPALLSRIAAVVEPGGVLVVEHRGARGHEPTVPPELRLRRTYRYGDTALTLLHPQGETVKGP